MLPNGMLRKYFLCLSLISFIAFQACAKKKKEGDPGGAEIDRTSAGDVMTMAADEQNVMIKVSALDQPFFMWSSVYDPFGDISETALQGKIVIFERKGSKLFLFEDLTKGGVPYSLPLVPKLLAELPIVVESGEWITFDFNEGMKNLFIGSEGVSPDTVLPLLGSYIQKGYGKADSFYILQVLQHEPIYGEQTVTSYTQASYHFKPYRKNDGFEAKESIGLERVGYFTTRTLREEKTGREITYAEHWDIRNIPITYYVSMNTPSDYADAVKEGILYWNKVFGKEILKAELLSEPKSFFEPGYNIIQWLDWDSRASCYRLIPVT